MDIPRQFHVYVACRLVVKAEVFWRLQSLEREVTWSNVPLLTFRRELLTSSHLQDCLHKTKAETSTYAWVKPSGLPDVTPKVFSYRRERVRSQIEAVSHRGSTRPNPCDAFRSSTNLRTRLIRYLWKLQTAPSSGAPLQSLGAGP